MTRESIEIQIMKLEDDIQKDLIEFPSWIRFMIYWYFRLTEPESRDDLDKLFNK